MGEAAKKIQPDETPDDLKDQVAMELAMLEGLKADLPAEAAPADGDDNEPPPVDMNQEDLEYPDLPTPAPPKDDDLDIDVDEAAIEEVGSLSAKQRFDKSMLENSIAADDVDDLDVPEDDDPTLGGFQLEVDELQAAAAPVAQEDEEDDAPVEGESPKQAEIRKKRKKALEEKKRQRAEAERKAQEERARQAEYERTNNILSIDELKRQALQSDPVAAASDAAPAAFSAPSSASAAKSVAAASELLAKKAVTPGNPISQQQQVIYAPTGPRPAWYKRLAGSLVFIVGELLKIAAPSALLYFYMEHDKSRELSTKALAHMATGDQFQIEVALNLLKDNFSAEHNRPYYELVKKKVERQLEEVWQEGKSTPEERGMILRSLGDYTFSDGGLDIPSMVKQGNESAETAMRERYENLYEAELKVADQKEVVDNLRQANIFLRQRECLKSYERFDVVLGHIADSLAATKGKILSINCAFLKSSKEAQTYFKKRDTIQHLRALNNPAPTPAPAAKVEAPVKTVAPRAPANSPKAPAKKSKR